VWTTPGWADLARFVAVGVVGFLGLAALDRMAAAAPLSVTAPCLFVQVTLTIALGVALGHFAFGQSVLAALLLTSAPLALWAMAHQAPLARQDAA
jgi:hypothetical protein